MKHDCLNGFVRINKEKKKLNIYVHLNLDESVLILYPKVKTYHMNYVLNISRFEHTGASLLFLSCAVDWPLYLFTLLTLLTSLMLSRVKIKISFLTSTTHLHVPVLPSWRGQRSHGRDVRRKDSRQQTFESPCFRPLTVNKEVKPKPIGYWWLCPV